MPVPCYSVLKCPIWSTSKSVYLSIISHTLSFPVRLQWRNEEKRLLILPCLSIHLFVRKQQLQKKKKKKLCHSFTVLLSVKVFKFWLNTAENDGYYTWLYGMCLFLTYPFTASKFVHFWCWSCSWALQHVQVGCVVNVSVERAASVFRSEMVVAC